MKEFLDDYKNPNEELTIDDVVKALQQFRKWIESDNDDTTEFKRTHVRTIFFHTLEEEYMYDFLFCSLFFVL
jgi:predicted urease superfamily metal-dependent hydrolase